MCVNHLCENPVNFCMLLLTLFPTLMCTQVLHPIPFSLLQMWSFGNINTYFFLKIDQEMAEIVFSARD